jgi:hypothetical protein
VRNFGQQRVMCFRSISADVASCKKKLQVHKGSPSVRDALLWLVADIATSYSGYSCRTVGMHGVFVVMNNVIVSVILHCILMQGKLEIYGKVSTSRLTSTSRPFEFQKIITDIMVIFISCKMLDAVYAYLLTGFRTSKL